MSASLQGGTTASPRSQATSCAPAASSPRPLAAFVSVFVLLDDFRVDHVVGLALAAGRARARAAFGPRRGAAALIQVLRRFLLRLHQRVERAADAGRVVVLERFLEIVRGRFDRKPVSRLKLVAGFFDELL